MKTVGTKAELVNAINTGEEHILCRGEIADILLKERKNGKKLLSKKCSKRRLLLAGVLCIASIAAAPFTAGTSLGMGAVVGGTTFAGATALASVGTIATGLTVESLTMTSKELLTICGSILVAEAIDKNFEIHFDNGFVKVDAIPTNK